MCVHGKKFSGPSGRRLWRSHKPGPVALFPSGKCTGHTKEFSAPVRAPTRGTTWGSRKSTKQEGASLAKTHDPRGHGEPKDVDGRQHTAHGDPTTPAQRATTQDLLRRGNSHTHFCAAGTSQRSRRQSKQS